MHIGLIYRYVYVVAYMVISLTTNICALYLGR